jgi:hypothetical protein
LEVVEDNLEAGEQVIKIAAGVRGNLSERVLMVLTDHKVLFLHEGVVRSSQESIPLDLITAVAIKKGVLWSDIKTTGAHSSEVITQVNKVDAQALAHALKSLLAIRVRSMRGARQPTPSLADELGRLAALRDRGVLTDDEFSAQKAKLLVL